MLQVWSNASTPWKLLYPRNIVAQAMADIHLRACVSAKGIKQSTCVVLSYNLHVDFAECVEVLYCFFFTSHNAATLISCHAVSTPDGITYSAMR